MRKKGGVSYGMLPRIEHLGRNIKFTFSVCYVMKTGREKKKNPNRPKKGQGHPKQRAKKRPPKKGPGEP